MPVATFLRDYWQQKPLLIRNAFATVPILPADELAGYSLETEVESRILIETPTRDPLRSEWQLKHGPFRESVFEKLPETHWTLLVQAVDQLHPQIHELLHQFRFIPNWRVDDVMVSYAADGGGVGPHFDYYDVFLLQAHGTRHWRLGQTCSAASPLRTDTECKILQHFDTQEDWLVHPGDLLYIPPNVAHWGVAQGECMTYSIGFRAPSYSDLLLDFCQEASANLSADQRFADAGRRPSSNPGEITEDDIQQVRTIVQQALGSDEFIRDWFGRYMTQPRRQSVQFEVESDANADTLALAAQARGAFVPKDADTATLFVNGEQFTCSRALAEQLCDYQLINLNTLSELDQAVMLTLSENDWVI
jgi:50S ribosomal protein L16 3-hydroxylase